MFFFPPLPVVGDSVVNPATGALYRWDGVRWLAAGEGEFLLLTGGEISGSLIIDGGLTVRGPVDFGP